MSRARIQIDFVPASGASNGERKFRSRDTPLGAFNQIKVNRGGGGLWLAAQTMSNIFLRLSGFWPCFVLGKSVPLWGGGKQEPPGGGGTCSGVTQFRAP